MLFDRVGVCHRSLSSLVVRACCLLVTGGEPAFALQVLQNKDFIITNRSLALPMSEPDTPEPDKFKDMQNLWETYRQVRRSRGLDISKLYAEFASNQAQQLPSPGAWQDYT